MRGCNRKCIIINIPRTNSREQQNFSLTRSHRHVAIVARAAKRRCPRRSLSRSSEGQPPPSPVWRGGQWTTRAARGGLLWCEIGYCRVCADLMRRVFLVASCQWREKVLGMLQLGGSGVVLKAACRHHCPRYRYRYHSCRLSCVNAPQRF